MSSNCPLKIFFITGLIIPLLIFSCKTNAETMDKAPNFSLNDLSGNKVSLKEYRGYVVLLDFWATWCLPCRVSIPELIEIQKKYKDKKLVILGLSLDDPRNVTDQDLSSFKKEFKINYTILRADEYTIRKYFGAGNFSIPTLFVVNQEGRIVDMHGGFIPGAVEKSLQKLFK